MIDTLAKGRLAVVLYGPLRTAKETAASLMRHVVGERDATLFYFGPSQTDTPSPAYRGQLDLFGTFKRNPKAQVSQMVPAEQDALNVYGEKLAAFHFHDTPTDQFLKQAEAAIPPSQWLMQLNPYRMFSMFFNIEGGIKLMLEHEAASGRLFDDVVITRPDLAFYSAIPTSAKRGQIHVPGGEGLNVVGKPHTGNAAVFYYKNVGTGDFVPGGRDTTFNDQFFLVSRDDLAPFLNLSDSLPKYLAARVPPSPETIFYLHLVGRAGLKLVEHPDWVYEIHRQSAPLVRSVTDTPEINQVDRRHPAAVEFRKRRPVYSLLRDGRWLARRVIGRFLR